MADMIQAPQMGRQIDRDLRAILDVMTAENEGKILYIRRGGVACADEEDLYTVTPLTQEG